MPSRPSVNQWRCTRVVCLADKLVCVACKGTFAPQGLTTRLCNSYSPAQYSWPCTHRCTSTYDDADLLRHSYVSAANQPSPSLRRTRHVAHTLKPPSPAGLGLVSCQPPSAWFPPPRSQKVTHQKCHGGAGHVTPHPASSQVVQGCPLYSTCQAVPSVALTAWNED